MGGKILICCVLATFKHRRFYEKLIMKSLFFNIPPYLTDDVVLSQAVDDALCVHLGLHRLMIVLPALSWDQAVLS